MTSSEEDADEVYKEPWYSTSLQIGIPFFLASIGTIIAGIILGNVENWSVYLEVSELYVLVPVLCGLKGNLDMCVASRISTQSNMGNMKRKSVVTQIVIGNLALVQVQAIVCSMLLTICTVVLNWLFEQKMKLETFSMLAAAALFTASTSCMMLDSLLMMVILFSQRYRFNPDYMATPIVASVGDVFTISLLSFSAAFLHDIRRKYTWICLVVASIYLVLWLPVCILLVLRNPYTRSVLLYGWVPVIAALCISQIGGFVLKTSVEQYQGFSLFSPIINGIGGNLVSVQASNMGTLLYQRGDPGQLPEGVRICDYPQHAWFYGTIYSRVSRILLFISVPGNFVQVYLVDYLYRSYIAIHFVFALAFVLTSLVQLLILLWLAHTLVHLLWRFNIDPDSAAIPYLTAVGDSLGTGLLAVMYYCLRSTDYQYQEKSSPWVKLNEKAIHL